MGDRKIRIMHVAGAGETGGVGACVLALAHTLDRNRYDLSVCFLGCEGGFSNAVRAACLKHWVLNAHGRIGIPALLRYFFALLSVRPEIVHIHVGGRMIRKLAKFTGARVITHFHGQSDDWPEGAVSLPMRDREWLHQAFGSSVDRHIACSEYGRRLLSEIVPCKKIETMHGPVDLSRFDVTNDVAELRRKFGWPEKNIVGFVGRLVPRKGVRHVLAVAHHLADSGLDPHFVIAGDGPERAELENVANHTPQPRITFLGERSDIPELMRSFDILLVPSDWEPFGIVSLEAMAAARPVIAFNVEGISEAVVNGETGILVPPGDDHALADAVARLLISPAERKRMGEAGRARAEREFSAARFAARMDAFYCEILDRHDG